MFKNKFLLLNLQILFKKIELLLLGEKRWESRIFLKKNGYRPNLRNPETLNEKIAWLKINYFEQFFVSCCDKYLLHGYLKEKLGKDYAPKLLFVTKNPKDLNFNNIKEFPCIIKVSNGSGANLIVYKKEQYTEEYLQHFFSKQILKSQLHGVVTLEHQYDIKNSYIVVEELLMDKDGGIPNDYKFLYINGQLEFVYCSVDRLGSNVRHVYDENWNRLHFAWVAGANESILKKYDESTSIIPPANFDKMKELSSIIAKDFPLVRVDFYETSGGVYIGEITLHHGSGHDRFYPQSYDLMYGQKLILPTPNRF